MHPDFSGKTLLITGGTGSFGNGTIARLLETGIGEIRIFSRDEKKQDDMRNLCRIRHPASWGKLRFYLGDVREPGSLRAPMEGRTTSFTPPPSSRYPPVNFSLWRPSEPTYWAQNMCWRPPQPPG